MSTKFSILFFIILIASFLRLWQLGSVPPSPSLDEVSIGYNALSILETGRDEYGTQFPILLRAYDDWRPAMHVYLVIPFVKLLGLTVLAVRLPAVILSILTVFATYLLARELFPKAKQFLIGEIAAFLLAISPWHIYISRLGHEVNEGLAFSVFGMLFFLKRKIYLAAIFFALAFMSYHPEKIFIPILLLGLAFFWRRELWAIKRKVIIAALLAALILLPFMKATFSNGGLARFEATNIFTAFHSRFEKQAVRLAQAVKESDFVGQIIYNRRVLALQIFTEGYISHFNPKWLFTNLSADRHKVPNLGLMYLWEGPLLLIGIFSLLRNNLKLRIKAIIFLWIMSSPLASSLTTDAPHAMRAYTMLLGLTTLTSLGLWTLLETKIKVLISYILLVVICTSLLVLYKNYFIVFPKTQSQSFQYALALAIPFVLEVEKKYDKIIFSNKGDLHQSYMFFLFFSRYDPKSYQEAGGTISGGFAETHALGKFEFRPVDLRSEKKISNALYVVSAEDYPGNIGRVFLGSYLDGKEGVKVIENSL